MCCFPAREVAATSVGRHVVSKMLQMEVPKGLYDRAVHFPVSAVRLPCLSRFRAVVEVAPSTRVSLQYEETSDVTRAT
jgi:hypothetical protein